MPTSGSIFQGVTTAPCRDYVAIKIAEMNKQVYMPCAGRFGSSLAYVKHANNAKNLFTSDICLFSSIIGYLFDPSKDIAELGIVNESKFQPRSDDPFEIAASAMLAIKYAQVKPSNLYAINMRRELFTSRDMYLGQIIDRLKVLVEAMKGAHYDIQDIWEVIDQHADDENACIFVNVPTYKGGYEKMFRDSGIKWNEPDIGQFDYQLFQKMVTRLTDAKCGAFVYAQKNLDQIPQDGSWQTVFAQPFGLDRTDYVVCNQRVDKAYAVQSTKVKPIKKYQIYDDSEITPDTKIEFIQVDETTALYYRDLFVHKLGTTTAEAFYLMLIDGKVNTALGLSMRDVFTQKSKYVGEVFGISRSSVRYKRLGKLFMMCLTSGDFLKMLESKYNFGTRKPQGIKTSSLTTYAEGKTDRSVMKLTYREQLKDGTYRVIYQGDFRQDTYKQCIETWLKRWGDKKREATT